MSQLNDTPAPRIDLQLIADMIEPGSRLLDIGCGDGSLLALLSEQRGVDGRGVEISQEGVNACVRRGLSVIQGDADTDLADYPDGAFDYAVLSLTIQATRNPKAVLGEMARIADKLIVSFPNFGNWKVRWQLGVGGRMPVTPTLGDTWYNTPNIHLCTLNDFVGLCSQLNLKIEQALTLSGVGSKVSRKPGPLANLLADQALFLLSHEGSDTL